MLTIAELSRLHGVTRQRVHALIRCYGVTKTWREGKLFISSREARKIPTTEQRHAMHGQKLADRKPKA